MIVLGLDPGFAAVGTVAVELCPDCERVVQMEVCTTEKSPKKHSVYASDDNVRRASILAGFINSMVLCWKPAAFCVESMSFPRNAGSSQKVGIAWGVISALSYLHRIPIIQQSPQAVKKAVCGIKNADKDQVRAALRIRYSECANWDSGIVRSRQEHAYDALATVVACLNSELLLLARKGTNDAYVPTAPDLDTGAGRAAPKALRKPRKAKVVEDDI